MSKLVGIALAAAFAGGLTISASAQLVTHKDLTTGMAMTMAETAIETCKQQGYNVSAHVVGRTGQVLVAMRGDNTGPHTLENSMKKAYTANAQKRSSGEYAKAFNAAPPRGGVLLTNLMPAQGALPIKVGEDTIGAIGVSGAPGGDKDEACAQAGLDSIRDKLDF
jgi:uncharacterized protein GlcG (DUF336 family)